jgi:hypothetical protein
MQGKQHDSKLLYALSSSSIINLVSEFVKGIMSWKKLQVKKYFGQPVSYLNKQFYLPFITTKKVSSHAWLCNATIDSSQLQEILKLDMLDNP